MRKFRTYWERSAGGKGLSDNSAKATYLTYDYQFQNRPRGALSLAGTEINFDVPAVLRKWPSLKGERVSASLGARPYIVFDGTLDECIRQFMSRPASQHHLYEIQTSPQAELITAVLSAEQVVELARLRDFL
jgi:hypothetical protein